MAKVTISPARRTELINKVISGQMTIEQAASRYKVPEPFVKKWVEDAGGIGTSADAGDDATGDSAEGLLALTPRFIADDGLEGADHRGEGVGAHDGADDVVRVLDRAHPVTHRGIGCILERA